MVEIDDIFLVAKEWDASDVHLISGMKPFVRIQGRLRELSDHDILSNRVIRELAFGMISKDAKVNFFQDKELDFSYQTHDKTRFRVNLYWEKGNIAVAARLIPAEIPTMEKIGMPDIIHRLLEFQSGLILVTGPTGHGKSTSLASMIQNVNENFASHIVTLEDPVEFIYTPVKSIISQRELRSDMNSFKEGLKHALRQDPNVILVGEMRDPDTIATTITLAETGHLVFATLHTHSAAQTIDRIIDSFPPHQQNQISLQLSLTLQAIVSQRLLPKVGGGRVAIREILINTPAVSNLIRENKIPQINTIIQTSAKDGMITFDRALKLAVQEGIVTEEDAASYISSVRSWMH
ncbi:MAG: PilT/PilU family type 4a pilus ATPase [Parcubacteria group bacterium]|nr:PilT/PilU family type 4a pilus ATPase [Parcubacteria group bacterium]